MVQNPKLLPAERIENKILLVRGHKVIVDADLAALYGIITKRLNEQVKRNIERFPEDFMFQLTEAEKIEVVAKCDHLPSLKFSKSLPYVFTEYGVIMAANIVNSRRAVEMSIFVVRVFANLRKTLASNKELAAKVLEIERRLATHDQAIVSLVDAIKQLMKPPNPGTKRPIGFRP